MLEHLLVGLQNIATLQNLGIVLVTTVAGMTMGAMPGLTATMAVALLVPFTYTMSPVAGLVGLGAIYQGAIYGGAFSAILINTPGTPSSIAGARKPSWRPRSPPVWVVWWAPWPSFS